MCNHKIKIKNPRLNYTPDAPKFIYVNCGKCEECRAQQRAEWFVRGYAMYMDKRFKSHFMATLTYSNDNLPWFYDDETGFETPCFNKKHIQNFMKLFRTNIERRFKLNADGIKYFCVSEFGSDTHRPHYHIILDIPFLMSEDEFREMATKSWAHGFVGCSKNHGFAIKSTKAYEYSVKYISKDMGYYSSQIGKYLDKRHLNEQEYERRYNLIKDYLPNHWQSKGYGLNIVSLMDDMSEQEKIQFMLDDKAIKIPKKNGLTSSYSLPKYIVQKMTHYMDKDMSDILGRPYFRKNDLGKKYALQRLATRCNEDDIDINKFMDKNYWNNMLPKFDSELLTSDVYNTIDIFTDILKNRIDPQDFVLYKNFLRYLPIPFHATKEFHLDHVEDYIDRYFDNEAIPREAYLIMQQLNHLPEDYGYSSNSEIGEALEYAQISHFKTFSEDNRFSDYELATQCLEDLQFLLKVVQEKNRIETEKRIENVRNAFKTFTLFNANGRVKD